jgi:ATP-binding cassette subfamily F protein uup
MAGPSSSSAILSAIDLDVRYSTQTVLDHASLAINEGERIGLVGRNGTGKSTFLRIVAGEADADSGQVVRRRELVSGYLPQSFQLDEAATVEENIRSGAQAALALIEEYEQSPHDDTRAGELLDRINHLDGWNIDYRIKSLMSHLGAPPAERTVSGLSGGEKRRVALARALLSRPDLLILDEPTNHLDTESIQWLEDFLAHAPGACLFVTHDRYFLDRVANRIVELAGGTFFSHSGNYTSYLEAKADRMASAENQEQRRQKFLKRELEWVRRGPQARTTKSRERMDRYAAVASQEAPEEELDVDLIIPPAPKLANRVIELREAGMEVGGRTLFSGLSINLEARQRLGIVGRNGMGKTTLLRIMLGELAPTEGAAEIGSRTQINYVDQARLQLDEEKTVFEEVGGGDEWVRLGEETVGLRNYLGRFLFTGERTNTKIRLLSGGERSRVALAKILKRGGNVIVLDEPTNDLDLATLRLLEEALTAFQGVVVAVSHDRYFLNRVCTAILAFEGEGRVHYDVGTYDDYLAKRTARAKAEAAWIAAPVKAAAASTPALSRKPAGRKLTWKETRELETIEDQIHAAETKTAQLEKAFAAPDFYQQHGARWQELQNELETAKREVARLYARWEELEALRAAAIS